MMDNNKMRPVRLTIAILGQAGNKIPHNSPVELEPGGIYTVSITVTNQSVFNGQPAGADLTTNVEAMVADEPALIDDTRRDGYEGGGSLTFTYPLQAPEYACSGQIAATVMDPSLNELAAASLEFNVVVLAPQVAIEELFIGTLKHQWETGADCRVYAQLKNLGDTEVSGEVSLYDWQAWWGDPVGDDRRQITETFTLAPGAVFRFTQNMHVLAFDESYIRLEVVVNNTVVLETPRIYYIPGKLYGGSIDPSSGDPAEGECIYTAPGLTVLWMASESNHKGWDGSYRTPPVGDRIHWSRFSFDTDYYDHAWWPAVFLVIFDDEFIQGSEYAANITAGDGASVCHYTTRFNFIAA